MRQQIFRLMGNAGGVSYVNYPQELNDTQSYLDQHFGKKGQEKIKSVQLILNAYRNKKFIQLSTEALKQQKVWEISESGQISENLNSGGRLGIRFTKSEDMEKYRRITEPLFRYLLKIAQGYSVFLKDGKISFFCLDTKRSRVKTGKLVHLDSKLISDVLTEDLFSWFVAAVTNKVDSDGLRVPVSKLMKTAIKAENCYCCREKLGETGWHAGHVNSVKDGGVNKLEQLRPLCSKCNQSMGAMELDEYMVRNNKPGMVELSKEKQELWRAVIQLTDLVANYQPNIRSMNLAERMKILAQVVPKYLEKIPTKNPDG